MISDLNPPAGGWASIPFPPPRIALDQPGTLSQQLMVIDCYLSDPTRLYDPAGAWEMARKLNIEHARRERL